MNTTQATMGRWVSGSNVVVAAYLDAETVRISNSAGETFCLANEDWLDRLDAMKDGGWHKA